MTLTRREVTELLTAHGLAPRRALGQNFVVDPNTVRRIARLAAVGPADRVIEIGAGLGSLTLALRETGAAVTAVEVDRGLVPVLRSVVEPVGVDVVEGDALDLDWAALLGEGPWVLVANLPYNVATPLVVRLLEEVPAIDRMLVMVQAEVADRLAATAGTSAYGAVSVVVAWWAAAKIIGDVPPTVFMPRPKVSSSLVALERRLPPSIGVDYARFKEVVRAGFGHRRKMLRGSLADVVDPDAFDAAGVAPSARAEELGLEQWGRLAAWRPNAPTPS
ncbi:MAG TPA: 16S rRNA (adenine(1518)-N(6)/adenine(1519)-N(6))-dimethyltransferase RsmA [Acidimicrobiia bacterium]|nr:16S rRNA (adenine(1518)-N(6)/adenine(1519)-N(6))-dimethyltransferase RsmA [Acidimicrobiia bacterium]